MIKVVTINHTDTGRMALPTPLTEGEIYLSLGCPQAISNMEKVVANFPGWKLRTVQKTPVESKDFVFRIRDGEA